MDRKRLYNPLDEKDAEILRRLAMESDEDTLSEANDSSDGEEDFLEEEAESTDTQQEMSSGDEDEDLEQTGKFVFGKDNKTKWKLEIPSQNIRTRSQNIVSHLPGVKRAAKQAKTPLASWCAFFDDHMLNLIVSNTNKYIESKKSSYSRERDCKTTDLNKINAFIGLLYMAGFHRNSRLNTLDLWATDGSGIEIFRLTMSRKRFHFLLQCVRFDDKETRNERRAIDKLAPIRSIFDMFVSHCQNNYCVGEYVTTDEMLPAFRGKCPFRMYIPSKPSKYGIKIISVVDAKVFYTTNLEIYVGQQPPGPYEIDNSSVAVVKRLCTPLFGTGRNITGDNWFTSYELVTDLLRNHKLTYVGTVRKNKRQIPPSFLSTRDRNEFTSKFCFEENLTLVSYIPKKGKNVLLLSSMHYDAAIDPETDVKRKPEIVTFYNETKSGVDVVDKMCATYSVSRNTNRWPMVVFYTMLNLAGINAHIIYKGNQNHGLEKRRHFISALALELTKDHIHRRSEIASLPKDLRKRTAEIMEENKSDGANSSTSSNDPQPKRSKGTEIDEPENQNVRKRGYICERKKNRMTRYKCLQCGNFICLEHSKNLCVICCRNNQ